MSNKTPVVQNPHAPAGVTSFDMYHAYHASAIWAKVVHDVHALCRELWEQQQEAGAANGDGNGRTVGRGDI